MNVLMLGLYAEGRTDDRFLPHIIQRTTDKLLYEHDRASIEALPPQVINVVGIAEHDKCILEAAKKAYDCGLDALIVHSDADNRDHAQTLIERFHPGYALLQEMQDNVCKTLVPIIPVRMVEAWMLVDPDALRQVLNVKLDVQALCLPTKAKLIEQDKDPKETLKQVVKRAYPGYERAWNQRRGQLYEKLAPAIKLDRLDLLPSYRQFVSDLTITLRALNLIH